MIITAENIKELIIGTIVFVAEGFKIVEKYQYMGLQKDYMIFFNYSGNGFSVYVNNPNHNYNLKSGNISTTYEECCARQRIICLNLIDHYNHHQFKNNPIIISESDKQHLYN